MGDVKLINCEQNTVELALCIVNDSSSPLCGKTALSTDDCQQHIKEQLARGNPRIITHPNLLEILIIVVYVIAKVPLVLYLGRVAFTRATK